MTTHIDSDLEDIDMFETELTTAQAAQLARVTPEAIRQWKSRGYLAACSTDRAGRPRFLGIDVAKAEHATRIKPQSRRAA